MNDKLFVGDSNFYIIRIQFTLFGYLIDAGIHSINSGVPESCNSSRMVMMSYLSMFPKHSYKTETFLSGSEILFISSSPFGDSILRSFREMLSGDL